MKAIGMRTFYLLLRMLIFSPYYNLILFMAVRRTRRYFKDRLPEVIESFWYGATYIDPKALAIWFIVATQAELQKAQQNGYEAEIRGVTRSVLARYSYPMSAISGVHIGMEARENIEAAGGFRFYFQ